MIFFAPHIDRITANLKSIRPLHDKRVLLKFKEIYRQMSLLKPLDNTDENRRLWLKVPRGSIKNFGDVREYKKEGLIETASQFNDFWKGEYPEREKWYLFSIAKYKNEQFFYIDGNLIFSIDHARTQKLPYTKDDEIYEFTAWLAKKVSIEIRKIKKNPAAYNNHLQKDVSFHKRFGRIRRKDFWKTEGESAFRLDKLTGSQNIKILKKIVQLQHGKKKLLPVMTANDFFRYCEFCYDANGYFKDVEKLTAKEKYHRMSDGRDSGLKEIKGDSEKGFLLWYRGKRMGDHPWEICRGGNSTHISLYVNQKDEKWELYLDGSSVLRVVETVKMAVALYNNGIPFTLVKGTEILDMISGNDFIGIVPDYIFPRYCHGYFPEKERIIDFMNLGNGKTNAVIKKAFWYPLQKFTTDYSD